LDAVKLDVCGTIAFGEDGVLLTVAPPESTCADPELWTLNGSVNANVDAELAALAI